MLPTPNNKKPKTIISCPQANKQSSAAFTLIELLVVISIIGLLASVVVTSLGSARAKARDARRVSDIHNLRTAIEFYLDDTGVYPPVVDDRGDGWDQSYDGTFMPNLVPAYIPQQIVDPQNTDGYHSYYYFGANHSFCPGNSKAVLHFYLETRQNAQGYTACSNQIGPYGHCLCFY